MDQTFINRLYTSHQQCPKCPSPAAISEFFMELLGTLFPDYVKMSFYSKREFELHIEKLKLKLDQILYRNPNSGSEVEQIVNQFFVELPDTHEKISKDVTALFKGDPAANSEREVIRSYPGFYAIAAFRIAHALHRLGVQVIPRMITEHAHSKTGIDIHPGAVIGDYFCIDHGTGVVIGETTHIGNHVKLYQGVTLGALSVKKEDAEIKRHPTLEDHVVVYAGATILGGDTIIGHHSIVGGNVWITKSMPPYTKIYYQAKMHNADTDKTDLVVYKSRSR